LLVLQKCNCNCVAVQADELIEKLRDAFIELLDEVPWMDDETRIVAREKVLAL